MNKVGYKCRDCGSIDSFEGRIDITQWGHEYVTFDGEGNTTEWNDTEITDSENSGDYYDIECSDCGSTNIDDCYDGDDEDDEIPRKTLKKLLED